MPGHPIRKTEKLIKSDTIFVFLNFCMKEMHDLTANFTLHFPGILYSVRIILKDILHLEMCSERYMFFSSRDFSYLFLRKRNRTSKRRKRSSSLHSLIKGLCGSTKNVRRNGGWTRMMFESLFTLFPSSQGLNITIHQKFCKTEIKGEKLYPTSSMGKVILLYFFSLLLTHFERQRLLSAAVSFGTIFGKQAKV